MITLRPAGQRGHTRNGWLESWHSFSFGEYHDPAQMGWGTLRVLNDDIVAPGRGFPMHGHRDMEIVTWILSGTLEHKDSLGNGSLIRPGEVQRMSAGRGIMHSEFNPATDEPVHLLQIWILPHTPGLHPGYEQQAFDPAELNGRLRLVASPDGRDGSLTLHQDTDVHIARLAAGGRVAHALRPGRCAYLHLARGEARLNGLSMQAGDGARIQGEAALDLRAGSDAELLLFDMPGE